MGEGNPDFCDYPLRDNDVNPICQSKEHVMSMIYGFDEVDLTAEEETYLEQDEPDHIL